MTSARVASHWLVAAVALVVGVQFAAPALQAQRAKTTSAAERGSRASTRSLPRPVGGGTSGTSGTAASGSGTVLPTGTKAVTFTASTAAFPNPDRGFYAWAASEDLAGYAALRAAGITLARQYFMLDAFRDQALPQWYLDALAWQFSMARQAGVKHIARFAYNFGPYPNPAPDATQARIEQHLQQLTPVLAANEDVISSVEAGFIGAWGEWHSSTNGLDTNPGAKAAILSAILAAVPPSRMVALRYPSDMQLLNGPPIFPSEAFTGTNRARVGSHQDCFLASDDDWGTWGRGGNTIAADKAYVAENGRWAVVGGETCNPNPPRSLCPTALAELEYLHFSNLDVDYDPTVIQGFRTGGCYDEIDRRLGYRLELRTATYPGSVQRGGVLPLNVTLANTGYAAMFNARPVFAVLSNGTTRMATPLAVDPRTWAAGSTHQLSAFVSVPATLPAGTYTLSLWLPDQAASLRDDPRFAVRFANQNTWDAASGENILARDVVVTLANGSLLAPPTQLRATAVSGNDVTLSWTPGAGVAATSVLLEGGAAPGQVDGTLPLGPSGPVTLRASSGVYYLRARAVSGTEVSVASNEIVVAIGVTAPPPPPANLLGLVAGNTMTLAWENPAGGTKPSAIHLSVNGSANGTLTVGPVDQLTVTGVPAGTYTITARASNAAGVSATSAPVTTTVPQACAGPPGVPLWLDTSVTGQLVTLTWGLPGSGPAPTSYVVDVSGAATALVPTPRRELAGTVAPGRYVVTVAAANPCGVGPATAPATVTVP